MSMKKLFPMVLFCTLSVATAIHAGQAADAGNEQQVEEDIVIRTDGKPQPPSNITKEDYVAVVLRRGGKVDSYLVKEIIRANRDSNYTAAIEKRDQGKYTVAAFHFNKALAAMPEEPWVKEYCNYGMADALFQAAATLPDAWKGYKGRTGTQYSAPWVYYKEALKANPKSRFFLDILVRTPISLAEDDKLAEADAALAEAKKGIDAYKSECSRLAGGYSALADRAYSMLALAEARVAEKKHSAGKEQVSNVERKYADAKRSCKAFPDLHGEALDGLFRVLIRKAETAKDSNEKMDAYNSAKMEAQSVISSFSSTGDLKLLPLLPGCYNVTGMANMAQGDDYAKNNNEMKANDAYAEARWSFLHVIAQFFDNDDYVAGAHFNAGICCDKLKKVEPKDAPEKAIRHWKVVVNNFPRSAYKELAEAELKRVGVAGAAEPAPAKKDEPKKDEPKKEEPKKDAKK
jgi:hypothetical protein